MSLKAKLEAVIYAAEEPVTLAQFAFYLPRSTRVEAEREAAAPRLKRAEGSPRARPR